MSDKKPQAGEWWMPNDGTCGPVFIIGRTDTGSVVFKAYKDCTPIVDHDGWDLYHHEPDCTGWDWQPETFPQWYVCGNDGFWKQVTQAEAESRVKKETPKREYVRLWFPQPSGPVRVTQGETLAGQIWAELKHDGTGFYLEDGK